MFVWQFFLWQRILPNDQFKAMHTTMLNVTPHLLQIQWDMRGYEGI